MTLPTLISEPEADLDIEESFHWYEGKSAGLGQEFLDELRAAYSRILDGPLKYQDLRSGVRCAWLRRFPYGVYFAIEPETIVVLAVLRASRDPAVWQSRLVSYGQNEAV